MTTTWSLAPALTVFDDLVLDLLCPRVRDQQALRKSLHRGPHDAPWEVQLLQQRVISRRALLQAVLGAAETYAVPWAQLFVGISAFDRVSRDHALELGLVPLADCGGRLYALATDAVTAVPITVADIPVRIIGRLSELRSALDAVLQVIEPYRNKGHDFLPFLHQIGVISSEQQNSALHLDPELGADWGRLAQEGIVAEEPLFGAIAAFLGRPFLQPDPAQSLLDAELARRFPRRVSDSLGVLPLRCTGHKLVFAITTPPSESILASSARDLANAEPHCMVVSPATLRALQHATYGLRGPVESASPETGNPTAAAHVFQSLRALVSATPAIPPNPADLADAPRLLDALLDRALRQRASDIHIERYEGRVEVRLRVDGSLIPAEDTGIDLDSVRALTTKIKVDARLDIAERRRPQDGVMRRRTAGRVVDFRVAVQPALWGENVVLRVLDQGKAPPRLDDLGLSPRALSAIKRLVASPQGLILLTGPTGSGKTTTLYAIIQDLKRNGLKIVTAEDPVEYAIEGVQQSQVDEAIGNTFDHYLRAFLRQDPDVILVGEIRDAPTAEMAVRAAMTGHLVLSTLHVNDALSCVKRLLGLGVDPGWLGATLSCVMSQRLLRCLCVNCCSEDVPAETTHELFPSGAPAHARLRAKKGCTTCNFVGYLGRTAAAELWVPSDEVRAMLERGEHGAPLEQRALADGLEPLAIAARRLVEAGVTSIEEVVANVPYDQLERHLKSGAAH